VTSPPSPADEPVTEQAKDPIFEVALLSDVGTNREGNEDSCGHYVENPESVVFAVADGIGGYEGGEVASAMAIEVTLESYRESPLAWGPSKRLHRAVQRANIEIHNRALTVPELRRMGTTLTAAVVDAGVLHAAHVGDCRLYLIRRGRIRQITKDHTMVQERVRMGLMSADRARYHPERSALTRSIGHELIVSVDRITLPLEQNDRLIICSDGLHGVLHDRDLEQTVRDHNAAEACKRLVAVANQRGTADNLTAVVFTMFGETATVAAPRSVWQRITGLFRRD
jgi:serine/threonine protein phosphatase PrpC